jgi:hypothetical protein
MLGGTTSRDGCAPEIDRFIKDDNVRTGDMGGHASQDFAMAILQRVSSVA